MTVHATYTRQNNQTVHQHLHINILQFTSLCTPPSSAILVEVIWKHSDSPLLRPDVYYKTPSCTILHRYYFIPYWWFLVYLHVWSLHLCHPPPAAGTREFGVQVPCWPCNGSPPPLSAPPPAAVGVYWDAALHAGLPPVLPAVKNKDQMLSYACFKIWEQMYKGVKKKANKKI